MDVTDATKEKMKVFKKVAATTTTKNMAFSNVECDFTAVIGWGDDRKAEKKASLKMDVMKIIKMTMMVAKNDIEHGTITDVKAGDATIFAKVVRALVKNKYMKVLVWDMTK